MNSNRENTKRIAKNTMMLYIRMLFSMLVSLYTSRVVLQTLGVEDYGIYNVVGGVVAMLGFLNDSMSGATSRFITYELGRGDNARLNQVFSTSLIIHVSIALFVFVLAETVGLWFFENKLVIPENRMVSARLIYHFSVISMMIGITQVPYNAVIISHEKMNVYAYTTIIDTVAKLILLLALVFSPFDKLITFAIGTFIVTLLSNSIYVFYNQKNINGTHLYFYWEYKLFRKLMSYAGWSFFGSISGVLCNQGLSIIMNLFFGVATNAAKAISDKIMSVVQSFVMNFYMAVSPQITKTYANNDLDSTVNLAFKSTRLGYYLMLIISVPVILLLDKILALWLAETYTQDMLIFTRLSLVFALINVFESPITFMVRATGNIKKYQISVGIFTLLVLPTTYLLYKIGCPAYVAFWSEIIFYAMVQLIRVKIASEFYPITIKYYIKEVLALPIIISAVIFILFKILEILQFNIWVITSICFIIMVIMVWRYGLHSSERRHIINAIKRGTIKYFV